MDERSRDDAGIRPDESVDEPQAGERPAAAAAGWPPGEVPVSPWAQHAPKPDPRALRVGSVVGRTLDTYAAGWPVFLLLSVPAALLCGIANAAAASAPLVSLGFALLSGVAASIASVGMARATADLGSGRPTSFGSAARAAAAEAASAVFSMIAVILVVVGLIVAGGVLAVLAIGVNPAISVGAVLVLAVVLVWLFVRWSLALPAIAFERVGPLAALSRSWTVSRRNVWRLLGLGTVLILLTMPLSLGASGLAGPLGPVAGGALIVLSTALVTPLGAIASAIAYLDLDERPVPGPVASGRWSGRRAVAALLLGIGTVLAVPAMTLVEPVPPVPASELGRILAGTESNLLDPCRPGGVKTAFSPEEPIHIGGWFSRAVDAGESITIAVYMDGELVHEEPLDAGPFGLQCYREAEPLENAVPAEYRIRVHQGDATLAEGSFTVR